MRKIDNKPRKNGKIYITTIFGKIYLVFFRNSMSNNQRNLKLLSNTYSSRRVIIFKSLQLLKYLQIFSNIVDIFVKTQKVITYFVDENY